MSKRLNKKDEQKGLAVLASLGFGFAKKRVAPRTQPMSGDAFLAACARLDPTVNSDPRGIRINNRVARREAREDAMYLQEEN